MGDHEKTASANVPESQGGDLGKISKKIETGLRLFLPELPSGVSGEQCTEKDHVDRADLDFMRGRVHKAIEDCEILLPGWKVIARGYEIEKFGITIGGHNNLELVRPGGKLFASLDTLQIDRKSGAVKNYWPGGDFSAPVVDDCILGNEVVRPENKQGELVIYDGGYGPEAMLYFAKAAVRLSRQNLDYQISPEQGKAEANSNSFARAYVKAASGVDPVNKMKIYADDIGLGGSPGLDVDLVREPLVKSRYDGISPDDFINHRRFIEAFCDDLKELHPVSQQLWATAHRKTKPEGVDQASPTSTLFDSKKTPPIFH